VTLSQVGITGENLQHLREESILVDTIRIRLGHESLNMTLAYLEGC
jgi:hypothetical protein